MHGRSLRLVVAVALAAGCGGCALASAVPNLMVCAVTDGTATVTVNPAGTGAAKAAGQNLSVAMMIRWNGNPWRFNEEGVSLVHGDTWKAAQWEIPAAGKGDYSLELLTHETNQNAALYETTYSCSI